MPHFSPKPLVSICVPIFNHGAYIWRALESSIHQTYQNIEIIVVDNASTDDTREVVSRYAKRDSRVKYFRNEANIGSGNNYLKCAEYSAGYLIEALGSDDWLSKNYIEEGVRCFLANPEAASIFARDVTFRIAAAGKMIFVDETRIKPGRYSADWFFRHCYNHPSIGAGGFHSLMRREDYINSLRKELERPTSLLKRGDMLEPIDGMIFPGVLMRYKYFVIMRGAGYVNTIHGMDHVGLQGGFTEDLEGPVRYFLAIRRAYEAIYADSESLKKYQRGVHFLFGLSILTSALSDLFRKKLSFFIWKRYFTNVIYIFFKDYTPIEKLIIVAALLPYVIMRAVKYGMRLFSKKHTFMPSQNYFLTEEFIFKAD